MFAFELVHGHEEHMLQLSDDTQTPQLSAEQLGWAGHLLWCLIVCGAGVKGRVRSDGTGGEIVRCCRGWWYDQHSSQLPGDW